MTPAKPLTARAVENLKPASATYFVSDGTVAGLQIAVYPSGRMIWSLRYRVGPKEQRRLLLGRYPALQLIDARKAANKALRAVDGGKDPAAQKRSDRRAMTFEQLVQDYVTVAKQRKSSWRQDEAYLQEAIDAGWKHRRVQDIRRADVIALVEAKATIAPVSANRLQSALSTCFRRAVDLEVVEANPCWQVRKRKEHTRTRELTADEIRLLWQHCADHATPIARMLRMCLLTAQRSGNVAEMQWSELELSADWLTNPTLPGAWWTIPKTKRGNAHRVWLSSLALDVLRQANRATPGSLFVFASVARPTTHCGDRSKKAMSLISAQLFTAPATRHDLRRTAATSMRAAGVSRTDLALVLDHALREAGSVTSTYDLYDGADEKRRALDALDARLRGIIAAGGERILHLDRGGNADWIKHGSHDVDVDGRTIVPKIAVH